MKSGIRRIMKTLDFTNDEQKMVADIIPDKMPDQSDATYDKFIGIRDNPNKFKELYEEDKFNAINNRVKRFWEMMDKYPDVNIALQKLEGCISTYSVHASGVVVCPKGKLVYSLPTKLFDSTFAAVCQYDMEDIEFIKALKLDILGLKTLSIIDITCKNANIDKNILNTEDYDSYPEVFKMLTEGLTLEVFQLSSPGITKMIKDMQLSNFAELTDALAMYRPGPSTAKDEATGLTMVQTYIDNKVNNKTTSLHPNLDKILSITQGCMIYQEQIMKIGEIISGYTLGQADSRIRKPISKKKIDQMSKIREEFINGDEKLGIPGALKMGYTEAFSNSLFDMIAKFAG